MKRLQRMLTLIAFLYILYHMYTFGIGALNGTLLVMCFISFYLEVMRERRRRRTCVRSRPKRRRKRIRSIDEINLLER